METTKKLKIEGLYVISKKTSSFRYCVLMSSKHGKAIRNYTKKPIKRVTDFIKLFEKHLSYLDWNLELDEFTEEHGKSILEMENNIKENNEGHLEVVF